MTPYQNQLAEQASKESSGTRIHGLVICLPVVLFFLYFEPILADVSRCLCVDIKHAFPFLISAVNWVGVPWNSKTRCAS
jgi:hypothetical protein